MEQLRSNKITNMERLRLVLLFALRYEGAYSGGEMKGLLRLLGEKGIGEEQCALVDKLLRYGGANVRSGDLFQNKSFFAQAKSAVTSSFRGVENVYTQHKS